MFTFCDGFSCDAEYAATNFPPSEYEYTNCNSDPDDMESEAFEMI